MREDANGRAACSESGAVLCDAIGATTAWEHHDYAAYKQRAVGSALKRARA